jgi:hypothetical protein
MEIVRVSSYSVSPAVETLEARAGRQQEHDALCKIVLEISNHLFPIAPVLELGQQ